MKSYRKQDMGAEQALAKFMDNAFYAKLRDKQGNPVKYERIKDYITQLQGIDIKLEVQGSKFLIDEKAAFYYSNQMIPTFAFEVDSIQKNSSQPLEGWLFNETLKTEYYMLIWPNVKCVKQEGTEIWKRKDIDSLQEGDFTIVEAMLIKKAKILEHLAKYNWSRDRIFEYAKKLRSNPTMQDIRQTVSDTNDFYFYFTKKLAEEPINIIMRKEVLRRLATANYFISAEKYVEIM